MEIEAKELFKKQILEVYRLLDLENEDYMENLEVLIKLINEAIETISDDKNAFILKSDIDWQIEQLNDSIKGE